MAVLKNKRNLKQIQNKFSVLDSISMHTSTELFEFATHELCRNVPTYFDTSPGTSRMGIIYWQNEKLGKYKRPRLKQWQLRR